RAAELVEAVGQLDAVAVKLEPQGRARVRRIDPGERGLGRRVAVHEHERACTEPRADCSAHQEIEVLVAAGAGAGLVTELTGEPRQLRVADGQRVCLKMLEKY